MTMAASLRFKGGVVVVADQLIHKAAKPMKHYLRAISPKFRYTEIYGVYSAIMVG